jgi:hypothetical protein
MSCMKSAILAVSLLAAAASPPAARLFAAEPATGLYHLAETFHVGGEGRWDYLTFEPESKLLYVTRTTHTMVIDPATGKMVGDIKGQGRNHGVAIAPAAGRVFISDSQYSCVFICDLKTRKVIGKIGDLPDADCMIYDARSGKVLISCGDDQALAAFPADIDPKTGKAQKVDLGGKPEFLAADENKIYVALVNKSRVAVVDSKTMKVVHKWPTAPGGSPAGLSLDADRHRLAVGCRSPQKLIIMSTDDGKVLADLPIGAGVDATSCAGGDIFASCRDATLAVARETSPGKFEIVQTVKTKTGSRTMALDPVTHTVFLPAAEFAGDATRNPRAAARAGSFSILVVKKE